MKILAAASDNGACTGYRIREPLNRLKKLGLAQTILIENAHQDFTKELLLSDIFMFGRAASGTIIDQIDKMHSMGKKVVFDLDDNIFEVSPYSQHYNRLGIMPIESLDDDNTHLGMMWEDGKDGLDVKSNRQFQMYFIQVLRNVDAVTCATKPLQELYSRFNRNAVHVPSGIDVGLWKTDKNDSQNKHFRILWTGAANHYSDAKNMMPVFEEIQKKYKNVRLAFVGNDWRMVKNNLDYSRVDVYPWVSYEAYPYLLKTIKADIGIAPIQMTHFDDCRSAAKWWEYSCLNMPTIATNHGPYKREMNNGKTGLLVQTDKEWVSGLSALIEDKALRTDLAAEALKDVKQNHNLDYTCDKWAETFQKTLEEK